MTLAPNRWGRRLQPVNSAMRLPLYFAIFLCLSSPGQQANLPGPGPAKQNVASALPLPSAAQARKPTGELDLPSRKRDELSHLNSAIQYYLSTVAIIQTAGSPTDTQYRDQANVDGRRVAELAFQSGRAEASFEAVYETGAPSQDTVGDEEQRLRAGIARVNQQVSTLTAQRGLLERSIVGAKRDQLKPLKDQIEQVDEAIDLDGEMNDALAKILSTSNLLGHGGLVGDIDRLQRTTPELINGKPTVQPPSLDSLSGVQLAGLSSQISALFQLHAARGAIDDLIDQTKGIEEQANGLEFPLTRIVQRMMKIDRIEHFSLLSVRLSQHSVQRCYKWHLQVADERQDVAPGLSAEDSVLVLQTNQIIPVEVEKLRRTLIGRAIFLVNLQPDPLETLSKDQNAEGKFKQEEDCSTTRTGSHHRLPFCFVNAKMQRGRNLFGFPLPLIPLASKTSRLILAAAAADA